MKKNKKMMEIAVMKTRENVVSRVEQSFSEQEKKDIVLAVLRGENSLDDVCRTYKIDNRIFFKWSKDYLEAENRKLFAYFLRVKLNDRESELNKRVEAVRRKLARL
jgi:transposase